MIEVRNLTKVYGSHVAVDHLNFTIETGRIYGFLGPNGAGKSTTMNIITGCLAATEGTVVVEGHDIFEEPIEAKKCIGYLPEIPPLYPDMTAEEYLYFVAHAKGVAKQKRKEEVENALTKTGLLEMRHRLMKNLSKGYKQRVGIAQAILGNPAIVILDEPTVGLDPKQIIEIRDLIRQLGEEHTVILSSHIMQEVKSVCDHIIIISRGKLVASDTPEHLSEHLEENTTLHLLVRGDEEKITEALSSVPADHIEVVPDEEETAACRAVIRVPGKLKKDQDYDIRDQVSQALTGNGLSILQMSLESLSLEDVFLELTQEGEKENDSDL